MLPTVIFDGCTLENFAIVNRLDLLDSRYGHRAAWTYTIKKEVTRGLKNAPHLQSILDAHWLGQPLDIGTTAEMSDIFDLCRRIGKLPSDSTPTRENLGEAEVIFLMDKSPTNWLFVTDDGPARDFARRRRLQVMNSAEVLADCHAMGDIKCPDAYELLKRMANLGRGVYVPPSHRDIC